MTEPYDDECAGRRCARCGDEAWDAIDLCEDCFGEVTLGLVLFGEYGSEEQAELIDAINTAPIARQTAPLRKARLKRIAARYAHGSPVTW